MQYFEGLSESKLKLDETDSILVYIRLRWYCTVGEKGIFSPARELLILNNAIRGCVYIVRRDHAVLAIDKTDASAVTYYIICDRVLGWKNEMYFVNRFFFDRSDEFNISIE